MSDELKIEKGVPLPGRFRSNFSITAEAMQVGDSVVVADQEEATRMRAALKRVYGQGSIVQKQLQDGTVRIWRKA
jgi:hypothetical protein